MAARRAAQDAEVVVVNHHLFFADVMLRDEGLAELLPACNTVVFDEAHQLPETASLFFGESVSTGQLLDLTRDTRNEAVTTAKDFPQLKDAVGTLEKAAKDLRLAFPGENPLGKRIRLRPHVRANIWFTIVGVVKTTPTFALGETRPAAR